MFKQIRIYLRTKPGVYPEPYWAYDLYSALLERLSPEYAGLLHQQELNPINQYFIPPYRRAAEKASCIWVLNILGEAAIQEITPVLSTWKSLRLRHYDQEMELAEITAGEVWHERDFVEKYLVQENAADHYRLQLLSPTSFKSNNEYLLFPSAELIVKSAVQKWNTYARETIIDDRDAVNDLIARIRINAYALRSQPYRFKGITIPAFTGWVNLTVRGPQPMLRLYNMLFNFLPYSGLGIKCSLGMGACSLEKPTR